MKYLIFFYISLSIFTFFACKKEIGKEQYNLVLLYDSGQEMTFTGKIYEKYKKNKKYLNEIGYGYSLSEIEKVGLYLDFENSSIAIKTPDKKIICNDSWEFGYNFPPLINSNQNGLVTGDIYLEGSYTQKGRAYTVDDGYFEFYWRNAEDFGMTDTILKGKWTLKRK